MKGSRCWSTVSGPLREQGKILDLMLKNTNIYYSIRKIRFKMPVKVKVTQKKITCIMTKHESGKENYEWKYHNNSVVQHIFKYKYMLLYGVCNSYKTL